VSGFALAAALMTAQAATTAGDTPGYTKPKVRAITAFVRVDPASLDQQVGMALAVLRRAKAEFEKQGYATETLRIVTQPLIELVKGQSDAQALGFLKRFDDLSAREGFMPGVGPAMMHDNDDPRSVRLAEKALSTLSNVQINTVIADDEGIHWNVIKETAALVHYVSEHSVHSQGDFQFTATAMLKAYGPFYPGTWHDGPGKQLSIGFEGANVVQEVFARTHGDFARKNS
jgi:hypothetical protein